MTVVFMGTPDFAVPTFEALVKTHNVAAVVTQPDKPKGRGGRIAFPPVKAAALLHGIPVLQPAGFKDEAFIRVLSGFGADVFVVAAYGRLLPESVLSMPRLGCVNVHASLLPKYRGAAPIHRALINGEKKTGVTIMLMDKGLDTGDMLLKKELDIAEDDNTGTLHEKLAEIGAQALIEALGLLESGRAVPERQDDAAATYAPMVDKETGNIDWRLNAADIVNLIRGVNPWPGAHTFYGGQLLKILNAKAVNGGSGIAGEIIGFEGGLVVKAGGGAVVVTRLQAQGGKALDAPEYLRGHKMEAGTVLCRTARSNN